ncbi:MAG: hypothetical protein HY591_01505 [Candidatus Omnitrophica bacterium]|nr:hypothetical protein [Candidatus Omnitrophota bacterium]
MKKYNGQTTLEYVVLIIIIVGALLAMQVYIKRGFQGRWKSTVDDFADQYDPGKINSLVNYSLVSNSDTVISAVPGIDPLTGQPGFFTNRMDTTSSVENKQGETVVGAP